MKCFLLLRSSFVVMEGKGLTHSPVTQRTAASCTFGVSVAVTHPWSGVPRVAPAGYKHGRSQGTGTCYPGICRAPSTTEPGPGHTRKARSCIMTGKTVAAVLILLLVSALGTQGKETFPKALLTNGQSKRWWGDCAVLPGQQRTLLMLSAESPMLCFLWK